MQIEKRCDFREQSREPPIVGMRRLKFLHPCEELLAPGCSWFAHLAHGLGDACKFQLHPLVGGRARFERIQKPRGFRARFRVGLDFAAQRQQPGKPEPGFE